MCLYVADATANTIYPRNENKVPLHFRCRGEATLSRPIYRKFRGAGENKRGLRARYLLVDCYSFDRISASGRAVIQDSRRR